MLKEIAQNLNIILDRSMDEELILNVLQSKLAYIFSFKNVKFKSSENLRTAYPLAYYGFSFVSSGGNKNRIVKEIDKSLLGFFNIYMDCVHKERQQQLKDKQDKYIKEKSSKENQSSFDKLVLQNEKDVENLKKLPLDLTESSQAKCYALFKMIKDYGKGSILIKNTEFAQFMEDAFKGDKSKKDFLNMLFDLYDGEYNASDTVTTDRENLEDLAVSCLFLSDYSVVLKDATLADEFRTWLKRGMARRSFFYYKKGGYLPTQEIMGIDVKEQCYDNLTQYSKRIKDIFYGITENLVVEFSAKATKAIFEYKQLVNSKILDIYKKNDILDEAGEILKLNLQHSPWKIIKLAVLYQILDNCEEKVTLENWEKAVAFFEKTHGYLRELLDANQVTDYDNLYAFLMKNKNKWFSRSELRAKRFVSERIFSSWIQDAITEIGIMVADRADEKQIGLLERDGGNRHQKREICIYEADKYKFNSKTVKNGDKTFLEGELIDLSKTGLIEIEEI